MRQTGYFYGAEGLAGQYNTGIKQYLGYHYDNIGSATMVTDIAGKIVEQFAYGTYGELLTAVKNKIRFLYNESYGVTTDENGLYYMRARYYNPDIKRFINQDITFGGTKLNKRQRKVLEKLQLSGDSIIVPKKSFSLKDLSALTAETGTEFAMFTTGGRRKIIRGDSRGVPIGIKEAQELFSEGWRWTDHTPLGYTNTVLMPSENDRIILKQFLN